jgi:uncharacterized membrane protein YqgA involved in biofilm formation
VQAKLKVGATIGELINIDQLMNNVFAYQERADGKDGYLGIKNGNSKLDRLVKR